MSKSVLSSHENDLTHSALGESVVRFVLYATQRAEERAGVEAHFPNQYDYIKTRCYFAVMSCHGRAWAAC